MGVYYDPDKSKIVRWFSQFRSAAVQAGGKLRLSYVIWQEILCPQWVLEIVSKTPGGEYDDKMASMPRLECCTISSTIPTTGSGTSTIGLRSTVW